FTCCSAGLSERIGRMMRRIPASARRRWIESDIGELPGLATANGRPVAPSIAPKRRASVAARHMPNFRPWPKIQRIWPDLPTAGRQSRASLAIRRLAGDDMLNTHDKTNAAQIAVVHPLDPLTFDEIRRACEIVRADSRDSTS